MSAADVGNVGAGDELGFDAVECRDPCAGKVVEVAGSEEPFAAAEDVAVVVTPWKSAPGPETLGDRVGGVHGSEGDLEGSDDAGGAGLVGEGDGMFLGEQEAARAVVHQVAACRLCARPFADVALGGSGAAGEVHRVEPTGSGHRAVEAELVADDDHRTAKQRSDVLDGFLDECGHSCVVHVLVPFCWCEIRAVSRWFSSLSSSGRGLERSAALRVADRSPKFETRSGVRYV